MMKMSWVIVEISLSHGIAFEAPTPIILCECGPVVKEGWEILSVDVPVSEGN